MKNAIIAIIIAIISLANSAIGSPISIYIKDVNITPQIPTTLDIINIDVLGSASQSASWVDHFEFSQNGAFLQLNLFVDVGVMMAPSNWSFSEQIGPFYADSYRLTVNAFENDDGTFKHTYTKDFVVTPEPTTILLLSLGAGLAVRMRHFKTFR